MRNGLNSGKTVKPGVFYGYVVAAAAFFTMLLMWGTLLSFGVFFKPMINEFGWTRAATSAAYSAAILLHGLLSIVVGRLTDRFGPRLVIVAGGVFISLGYLLMSQVSAIWQLYLFFGGIVGIGMGASFVPMVSTIARWFTKRRGMMTGIVVSGVGIGGMIIPPVVGQLISLYGWQDSYKIIGIVALVGITLAALFMRRDPYQMGLLPYGERAKSDSPDLEARGFSLKEAIHSRQFWILGAAFLCFGYLLETIAVHIAPQATELGVSIAGSGTALGVLSALSAVGRIVMGSASDKIGNKRVVIIGFILLTIALFGLALTSEIWTLYLFAAIFGFAFGGVITMQSPLVAELFGMSSHGVILGVIIFIDKIGGAIGPILTGRIFDVTGSYQLGFLITGALSIVGLLLATLLRRKGNEPALR